MNKILIFLMVLAVFALLAGCDQNIAKPKPVEGYYLAGAAVKNLDTEVITLTATLKRNDTLLATAILRVGDDTLTYVDGKYIKFYDLETGLTPGNYFLHIVDSTLFEDSILFYIPGSFEITSRVPPDESPLRPGNQVQIVWSTLTNSDGYAYAAAKKDSVYNGDGYSAFVTTEVNAVTFNNEAFALPSGELDTGWYYIYVYGYVDVPVAGNTIPTVFPSGLSNNIFRTDFTGRFGTIVVTPRDSVHAETQ